MGVTQHWPSPCSGMFFPALQCMELPGWGLMGLCVGALVLYPWCSGKEGEQGTVWAAELSMCSSCFLLCA